MKDIINRLNPAFDQRNRLGLMALLVTEDVLEYNTLKELLDLTDGNLASHLRALESQDYIRVEKTFVERKPRTSYRSTPIGKKAFSEHIKAMQDLIEAVEE
ncbi:MAG: transcriptional regulator [Saprospiraceae bacterium]|nr:transcriptional regulator [Saprospiraceae bacterium]